MQHQEVVGIIGLGYVGLPLAVAFASQLRTLGFDHDTSRIQALRRGDDITGEVSREELSAPGDRIDFIDNPARLAECTILIVAVPTPVTPAKQPDLSSLIAASETVGRVLQPDMLVVFESTVFPGATEEVCVPILERISGLTCGRDFEVGYSPERINPGDRTRRLGDICKVVAASSDAAAERLEKLYRRVVHAGTYRAASIRVAEAAKVIENTQRDVNIALINELAMLFARMGIDTGQVLETAGTKWNFLPFRPGLVGGHCIGVDPYYLTHKAQSLGFHPEMILAGRRINDRMGAYVAATVIKLMAAKGIAAVGARALVLGITFKENCPDVRNSGVLDVITELKGYGMEVDIVDPVANGSALPASCNLQCHATIPGQDYAAAVLTVAHDCFRELSLATVREHCAANHVLYDVKGLWPAADVDGRL